MRALLRKPLTWMVIAECIVITLLIVVVWNMVAAAATQHPALAVQTLDTPAGDTTSPPPDLTEAKKATPGPLPGLNLDAGFWRFRLGRLNQDQVILEQLEWRIVHNAMDAAQHYVETVVLPSIARAERPT
jgi:hypothetical protein